MITLYERHRNNDSSLCRLYNQLESARDGEIDVCDWSINEMLQGCTHKAYMTGVASSPSEECRLRLDRAACTYILQYSVPLARRPIRRINRFSLRRTSTQASSKILREVRSFYVQGVYGQDSVQASWDSDPSYAPRCSLIGCLSRYLFLPLPPSFLLQVQYRTLHTDVAMSTSKAPKLEHSPASRLELSRRSLAGALR